MIVSHFFAELDEIVESKVDMHTCTENEIDHSSVQI